MEEKSKQRIIGILVLIGSLFIILPFLFHNSRPVAEQPKAVAAVPNAITPPAVSVTLPAENNTAPNNNTTVVNTQATQPAIAVTPSTPAAAPTAQMQSAQPVQQPITQPVQSAEQQPAVLEQKSPVVAQVLPKAVSNGRRAQSPRFSAGSSEPLKNSHFPYRQKSPAFMPEISKQTNSNTIASRADASGFKPDQAVSPTSGLTTGAPISTPSVNQATADDSLVSTAQTTTAQTQSITDESTVKHKTAHHHAHAAKGKEWEVQLAVFASEHNAKKLMTKLHTHHFAAHTRRINHHGRHMIAVYVGPEHSHQKTLALQHHLRRELHMNGEVKRV